MLATSGDFSETDNCTAAPIAPGQSCAIQIRFLPAATGSRSGVLTVYGNVSSGQATATLSGTGNAGSAIVLNPLTLSFPSTAINSTSSAQNITISNTGSTSISLQVPSITGADFKFLANTCGATLGSSTGCTVSIVFIPTASGTRSGTFTIIDDAGTQTASLSGSGVSPATDALSPLALTFAAQQITTASGAQQVTLTNSGDLPLTLIAAQITSGDFTAVNTCGNSLNPHSSCSINVAFVPKNVGPITGVLAVSDQYRTQTVIVEWHGPCTTRSLSLPFLDALLFRLPVLVLRLPAVDSYADEQWRRSAFGAKHRCLRRFHHRARQQHVRQQFSCEHSLYSAGCIYTDSRRASFRDSHRH